MLLRPLGFSVETRASATAIADLGLPEEPNRYTVLVGSGPWRALALVTREGRNLHDLVTQLARDLSSATTYHWLLALTSPQLQQLAIATWSLERRPPRPRILAVDCRNVMASDAAVMAELEACAGEPSLLRQAHWLEILGREAICGRFYSELARSVKYCAEGAGGNAPISQRREFALLQVARLIFLAFLENKGWLDADAHFLVRIFDECMQRGGGFQRRVLRPLFFGTLNTPAARRAHAARAFGQIPFLNGGLFQPAPLERSLRGLEIPDECWGDVFEKLLLRYRFSARESQSEYESAAVDPEILGRAFESLIARDKRHTEGIFFTPFDLVERTTRSALGHYLSSLGMASDEWERAIAGQPLEPDRAAVLLRIASSIAVLDPACGSGAFLVHVLERLEVLLRSAGEQAPPGAIRRRLLARSLFGVDRDPMAVWLCELRLWLAVVVVDDSRDPLKVDPLPNLDHNIRCGDTLLGGDFTLAEGDSELARLRTRYARASGARKRTLKQAMERRERAQLVHWYAARDRTLAEARRSLLCAARGRDLFGQPRGLLSSERAALEAIKIAQRSVKRELRRLREGSGLPFVPAAHFADIASRGGFDIVLGNPPWIRVHNIPRGQRSKLRREFRVFRVAAWSDRSRPANTGKGFAMQVDAAALFLERGLALLRRGGVLSFLVPAKLWRSLAGGGIRQHLLEAAVLCSVEDWSDAPPLFGATTYPSSVTLRRHSATPDARVQMVVHRRDVSVSWQVPLQAIPLDESPGAPWLALPPAPAAAFRRLIRAGPPLVSAGLGRPTLGVKCGCNAAYLVTVEESNGRMANVRAGNRRGAVETCCLRPLLAGRDVAPWRPPPPLSHIVFPCDGEGHTLRVLPPSALRWLAPWRPRLERRADAGGGRPWWALFRTEGARSAHPRVVWSDIGRNPTALVLEAGSPVVPLNTCYVLATRDMHDALALACILNSALAAAWLAAVAEPARNGYRRFMAWTIGRLPLPENWDRARDILEPVGREAFSGRQPSQSELLDCVLAAYRIRWSSIAPLIEWQLA